ncbi:unnamed protein product [Symbiodinium sp. KB8]|nr:unnamed protein product [Symbiodinium sp. KB8]
MLGVTAAPVVGSFVAFTVVQRAVIGQGVDPVGVTSVLAPAAALVVPNLAFMASRGGIKVNPFLVGTAYATVVAEIYRQLGTRSYKYNMGRKNGL